jgi:hypothetical protein
MGNKAKAPSGKILVIAAKHARYFSAGITEPFTHEQQDISLDDLTDEQQEELRNDPHLIVVEKDAPAPKT